MNRAYTEEVEHLKLGIVGLPNVGKSTLFNAITRAGAQAANYPFCTIEPNTGVVPVPDPRLDELARMYEPKKVTPATVEFVDIAGLVKGASRGEGLGNKFLGNIRNTNAIIHVLRCFDNSNITHVDGSVDPVRDKGIIDTELQLKDLETVENRLAKTQKRPRRAATRMPSAPSNCCSNTRPYSNRAAAPARSNWRRRTANWSPTSTC